MASIYVTSQWALKTRQFTFKAGQTQIFILNNGEGEDTRTGDILNYHPTSLPRLISKSTISNQPTGPESAPAGTHLAEPAPEFD